VQAGDNIAIFDVCKAANVQDEFWAAASRSNFIAGALYITIGKPQFFASVT
jgi:hypothetical protein